MTAHFNISVQLSFSYNMAPAMKAMKAMKAGGAMTATGAFSAVAEKTGTKSKDVKAVITNYMELAASELKKNGAFKIGGCLNLKLKKKPARPARKGVNPFTKEPCVFQARRHRRPSVHWPWRNLRRW